MIDVLGSQFYITYAKAPHLDNVSTIFARVIAGFDTLDAVEKVLVNSKHRPLNDIKLLGVTVHANPFAQS
jgi:peptidyl-prolyl cis-trans isomerase-like 3